MRMRSELQAGMPALPGHFRSSIIIQLYVDPEPIMRYDTDIPGGRDMKVSVFALLILTMLNQELG